MDQRHSSRLLPTSTLLAASLCAATGIMGTIIYHNNHSILITKNISFITLLVSEFISVIAIPTSFIKTLISLELTVLVLGISGMATFFSSVFFFLSLTKTSSIPHLQDLLFDNLFKGFFGALLASLFTIGISFGQHIQELLTVYSIEYETEEEPYELSSQVSPGHHSSGENSETTTQNKVMEKLVSLKASAATLVDTTKNNPQNPSQSVLQPVSTISSSTTVTKLNKQPSIAGLSKLPIIHQNSFSDSSSFNLSQDNLTNLENKHLSDCLMIPPLTKSNSFSASKNFNLERDAIKRIPSVLLPPHLKPFEKPSSALLPSPILPNDNNLPQSMSDTFLNRPNLQENVIQSIPRVSTIQDMFPYSVAKTTDDGPRTISLDDWEKFNQRQQQSLRPPANIMASFIQQREPHRFSVDSGYTEVVETIHTKQDTESITETNDLDKQDDSTEEVMKYIEDAADGLCDDDIINSAINQSQSNIPLEEESQNSPTKGRGYSPQRSIFKHHSRKSSITSFNFKNHNGGSVPSSPRKSLKTPSPKKLRLKTLSLSSIVYKDNEDSQVPDMTYVHELQSGNYTTRKSFVDLSATTPTKNKTFDKVLKDQTNTTPDSTWSENSRKSTFPSDVIGEYDKEKWKTMERLNMVAHQEESP